MAIPISAVRDLGTFAWFALEDLVPSLTPQERLELLDFDREPRAEIRDDLKLIRDRPLQQPFTR